MRENYGTIKKNLNIDEVKKMVAFLRLRNI